MNPVREGEQDVPPYTEAETRETHRGLHENLEVLNRQYNDYGTTAMSIGASYARGDVTIVVQLRQFVTENSNLTRDLRNFNTQVESFNASLRSNPVNGLSIVPRLPLAHILMNQGYHNGGGDPSTNPFTMTEEGTIYYS